MTTIAFDGIVLAADTQINMGDRVLGYRSKIHKVNGGILAFSGSVEDGFLVIEWLNSDRKNNKKPQIENFHAIFICDNGDFFELYEKLVFMPVSLPWLSGSGAEYAYSAMKLGFNTTDAVNFAASIDLFTGGNIESIFINTKV